jgi:outer membrane lipoprotein-sorting protein
MLLIGLLSVLSAAEAPPALNLFLQDFARKREHIVVLEARFSQENITPDDITEAEGDLLFVHPRRIVFRYMEVGITYLVDDTVVYEHDAENEQVRMHDMKDEPALEALFLGFRSDIGQLLKTHEIRLFDPGDERPGTIGLELTPKPAADDEEAEAVLFERARLFLRLKDYVPVYVHLAIDKESENTLEFHDIKVNPEIAPGRTQLDLPEGTRIIDSDENVKEAGPDGARIPEAIEPKYPQSDVEQPAEAAAGAGKADS